MSGSSWRLWGRICCRPPSQVRVVACNPWCARLIDPAPQSLLPSSRALCVCLWLPVSLSCKFIGHCMVHRARSHPGWPRFNLTHYACRDPASKSRHIVKLQIGMNFGRIPLSPWQSSHYLTPLQLLMLFDTIPKTILQCVFCAYFAFCAYFWHNAPNNMLQKSVIFLFLPQSVKS